MLEKQYAFWNYDLFPHILYGEIDHIDNDKYYIKGYGNSYFLWTELTPKKGLIAILPESQALGLIKQIKQLKKSYEDTLSEFESKSDNFRTQLMQIYLFLINGLV